MLLHECCGAHWLLEMNWPNSNMIRSATLSCRFLEAFSLSFQSMKGLFLSS